jgi:hypothetical protein
VLDGNINCNARIAAATGHRRAGDALWIMK